MLPSDVGGTHTLRVSREDLLGRRERDVVRHDPDVLDARPLETLDGVHDQRSIRNRHEVSAQNVEGGPPFGGRSTLEHDQSL